MFRFTCFQHVSSQLRYIENVVCCRQFLAHSKNELIQWRGVRRLSVCSSVRLSVCKLLRKSLLLVGKWPDRYQTFTRWTPGQRASRVCSRSTSRSKVTRYAHFHGFLEWATPSLTVWYNLLTSVISIHCIKLTTFFQSQYTTVCDRVPVILGVKYSINVNK